MRRVIRFYVFAIAYILERDTFGKLASELCRPEEALLYAEDLQSGSVHGWRQLKQKLELNLPWVSLADEPEQPGNKVLIFKAQNDGEHNNAGQADALYADAVLRYSFKMVGDIHHILQWNLLPEANEGYIAFVYGKQRGGRVEVCSAAEGTDCQWTQVGQWNLNVADGKWHTAEMSSYQGEVQYWIDGKKLIKWTDPHPLPEGGWSLGFDFWKADASAYFDNFAICSLKAPFESIHAK